MYNMYKASVSPGSVQQIMHYFYSPFAETRQRKQSKPRVATADSKVWTKRAVSSVYSLHSDAR
jgi:hypothetical protein